VVVVVAVAVVVVVWRRRRWWWWNCAAIRSFCGARFACLLVSCFAAGAVPFINAPERPQETAT
jgi:hypothetical protein